MISILKKENFQKTYPWLMIFLSAMLYSFGMNAFVVTSGIFPTGLMSIGNLIIYLSPVDITAFLSLIYLGLNVPLIILFWKKLKPIYIYKTLFFLVTQALFGLIFMIPSVLNIIPNIFWNGKDINFIREQRWTILVLAALGSMIASVGLGIVWKNGGSAGGTDFFTYYYSSKYKKPIGKINFIISLMMVAMSFSIAVAVDRPNQIRQFWFIVLLGTIIYLFILMTIVDLIYPKYSKVQISIYSNTPDKISQYLKDTNFPHSWAIIEHDSGYTGNHKKMITTTILLLELRDLVKEINKIDSTVWINVMKVKLNFGRFNTSSVDAR